MSSEGALLGPRALEQIRQLIRDDRSRYQNPEGHRARWLGGARSGTPCAEYDILIVEGGPTSGTIDWEIYDVTDNSSIETGTYTLGDAVSTISSPVIAALGFTVPIIGGPLPANEITLHLNRGRTSTKYKFRITAWSLTGGSSPYAKVASCCVAGG